MARKSLFFLNIWLPQVWIIIISSLTMFLHTIKNNIIHACESCTSKCMNKCKSFCESSKLSSYLAKGGASFSIRVIGRLSTASMEQLPTLTGLSRCLLRRVTQCSPSYIFLHLNFHTELKVFVFFFFQLIKSQGFNSRVW